MATPGFWPDLQDQFLTQCNPKPSGAMFDLDNLPLRALALAQGGWDVVGEERRRERFIALATRAAVAGGLSDGTTPPPVYAWLNRLKDGPYYSGGVVEDLADASADLCLALDTEGFVSAVVASRPVTGAVGEESTSRADLAAAPADGLSRRARVDQFLRRCNDEGDIPRKIIRADIWRAARRTDKGRQFQRWQSNDPKATRSDDRDFERVLGTPPADFIRQLFRGKGRLST